MMAKGIGSLIGRAMACIAHIETYYVKGEVNKATDGAAALFIISYLLYDKLSKEEKRIKEEADV